MENTSKREDQGSDSNIFFFIFFFHILDYPFKRRTLRQTRISSREMEMTAIQPELSRTQIMSILKQTIITMPTRQYYRRPCCDGYREAFRSVYSSCLQLQQP